MELHPSEFYLRNFLASIVKIFHLRAEQKGIEFIYSYPDELPACVKGDEQRLRQILINLLGNAIKFTNQGSVTFQVELIDDRDSATSDRQESDRIESKKPEEYRLKNCLNKSYIRFQVKDTGVGIAPEQIEEIFLPFQQARNHTRTLEGTGLGLSISKKLAEIMGSELRVNSIQGEGSIFWLDLDLPTVHCAAELTAFPEYYAVGYVGERRKILIADDNQVNRLVLVNLLNPLGFDIVEAVDGRDCLHKTAEYNPDAIFIDLAMPVMDGLEAIRQLRQSPNYSHMAIIVTSASAFEQDNQASLAAGANGFVPKPVHSEAILASLHAHLGVQWIYASDRRQAPSNGKPMSDLALESFSHIQDVPPLASISELYDLTKIGDIKGILDWIASLEQSDVTFKPFTAQIRQLVKGFQVKQIQKLVSRYISSDTQIHNEQR
ncbi:MAG: response regulator [Pseudanabaena sp. CRU_2_10]|nr:response regulator [Pseudanabaena sp. CRU_2_10]